MAVVIDSNKQLIKEILESVPIFKEKVDVTIKEFNNYLENFNDEKFVEISEEKEEDAIKRIESVYDKMDEVAQRREVVMKNIEETIGVIDDVKVKIKIMKKICESKGNVVEKTNDELIDKIIELKKRKLKKEVELIQSAITPLAEQIERLKEEFNENEEKLNEEKDKKEENKQKKEEKGHIKKILLKKEVKQLEDWTGMNLKKIVFDSKKNKWGKGTIEFDQRIIKESNLLFLIEDANDNIFGGYVNAKIDDWDIWINDPISFVFSLRPNGRLNEMMKFDIKNPNHAFALIKNSSNALFKLGDDISIYKEEYKTNSCCQQNHFEYRGIENALRGSTSNFTPTRIVVIQLV